MKKKTKKNSEGGSERVLLQPECSRAGSALVIVMGILITL